ncbi:MAG TPA: efflux RND transporter periplasmic adaptor subunit [Anaerolineaceae bacterium]|nr:efflux RND transporter periplasmic adaptor subunit [Anaerolineaceae bacterium]
MKLLKKLWWILAIVVIAAGGFVFYQNVQAKQTGQSQVSQQTVKVTKGEISTTVSATGSVRSNQNTIVSWTVSGKVGKVLVSLGDQVKADQILASLDSTSLPQTVLNGQQDLIDARQALENLQSSKVDIAQAQSDLVSAQTALEDATKSRAQLDYARGTQGTIASAEANYILAQNNVDKLQRIYDNMSSRPENDPGRLNALANLENAKKARDKALATVNWYKGKPSIEDIAAADAAVALAQAQYDDALRTYNRLKNGPTAAEITAAQNKVTAAQALIDSVNLTAPIDGVVTSLDIQAGDLVSSGTQAVRIDDLSGIFVDLSVSEVDINNIQAGQAAAITFDAIPNQTYSGEVTRVGQVGESSSGSVSYTVTVQISDPDAAIKSGMTAAASITTSTVSDALLVPTRSIKTVNKQKVVYVSSNGQVTPVNVETGLTSDTMTQIVSGNLKEGELVLSNPTTSTTTATNSGGGPGIIGILSGGGSPAGGGAPPAGGPSGNSGGSSSSGSSSGSKSNKGGN